MDAVTLSAAINDAKRKDQDPETGKGWIAYAKNDSGTATTVSAAAVGVGFCEIDVPASTNPVFVFWEIRLGIVTAPGATYGGSLDGILWEVTMSGSTIVVTEVDRCPLDVAAGRPIKLGFGKAAGRYRVDPSAVTRRFALGAGLVKDNAAGTLVGQVRNQPAEKSWIGALA